MTLYSEKLANLEARIDSIQMELVDYMERNPKSSDQWVDARLGALEAQIKLLVSEPTLKVEEDLRNDLHDKPIESLALLRAVIHDLRERNRALVEQLMEKYNGN